MLGHASAAMTLDVHADLFDADHGDVAERLDEAIRAQVLRTGADQMRTWSGPAPRRGACWAPSLQVREVPPARFELATHGLGNRCSIP